MGEKITLTASDGVTIGAYKAVPVGRPRGGIVVIQEIFGINPHIQAVADGYAAEGYLAIAPALFDRLEPGIELGYTGADWDKAIDLMNRTDKEKALLDIEAAVVAASAGGKVGIVGFCFGGLMTFISAARVPGLSAAVAYYGGGIADVADLKPKVPLMLHFGERDEWIPPSAIDKIRAAQSQAQIYLYPTGHAFNRAGYPPYDEASATLAKSRTLGFFAETL